jgi:hypothetical protein
VGISDPEIDAADNPPSVSWADPEADAVVATPSVAITPFETVVELMPLRRQVTDPVAFLH